MLLAPLLLDPYSPDSFVYQFYLYWHWIDPITRGTVDLLALMFMIELVIAHDRFWRFHRARRQSREFVRNIQALFSARNLEGAIERANAYPQTHIAGVIRAGLEEFLSIPPGCSHEEATTMAERAMRRAKARIHQELKGDLGALGTIISTAPFLGLMGTVFGILGSFGGMGMNKASALALIAFRISESLLPTALGLLVAVLAVWFYNYFFERLEICDIEAANATSELAAYLASHRAFRSSSQHPAIAFAASKRIFDLQSLMLVAVGYFGLSLLYQMPFFLMPLTVSVLCCLPFWLARRRDSRILLLP